jgi:diguanylate cyclase (GGDEF)-like protein
MISAIWRIIAGPLATTALAGGFWLLDRRGFAVPAPGALLLLTVVLATWFGGLRSGFLSGVICVTAALPVLVESTNFLTFVNDPRLRVFVLFVFAVSLPLITAGFRARAARALDKERQMRAGVEEASRELVILHAALDNVDYAVILLDENLRARFINRASRKLWSIADELADSRPSYRRLMRNACDSQAFAMAPAKLDAYVDRRVALVRAGDETPLDLHLANGTIVRFQCKALPAGGRFLSYTDVTDLVRHAEALERLATTDELTGICNRRRFLELAAEELAHYRASGTTLALMILDVDLFKSINDRFGHLGGDAVIRDAVTVCQSVKRDADILARIGGEEFVLLMPATHGGDAVTIAEDLRRRFEAAPFVIDGESLRVTVSIGVAESDPAMTGLSDLMRRADQALYEAKRGGRNRVRFAGSPQCLDSKTAKPRTSASAA